MIAPPRPHGQRPAGRLLTAGLCLLSSSLFACEALLPFRAAPAASATNDAAADGTAPPGDATVAGRDGVLSGDPASLDAGSPIDAVPLDAAGPLDAAATGPLDAGPLDAGGPIDAGGPSDAEIDMAADGPAPLPDAGCPAGQVLLASDFSEAAGWQYPEAEPQPGGSGLAQAVYSKPNTGGSTYNTSAAGLFTVPTGCRARVRVVREATVGSMSLRLYDYACKSDKTCNAGSIGCFIGPGSGYSIGCSLALGGRTFYTLRLERADSQGATATASFVEIRTE